MLAGKEESWVFFLLCLFQGYSSWETAHALVNGPTHMYILAELSRISGFKSQSTWDWEGKAVVEIGKELKGKRVGVDLIKYNILMSEIPKQLRQTNKTAQITTTLGMETGIAQVMWLYPLWVAFQETMCSTPWRLWEVTSCLKARNNSLLACSCWIQDTASTAPSSHDLSCFEYRFFSLLLWCCLRAYEYRHFHQLVPILMDFHWRSSGFSQSHRASWI